MDQGQPEMTRRASNTSDISRLSEFYQIKRVDLPGFKSNLKKTGQKVDDINLDEVTTNKKDDTTPKESFKLTIANKLLLFMNLILLCVVAFLFVTDK
jgi:hypothetical protein